MIMIHFVSCHILLAYVTNKPLNSEQKVPCWRPNWELKAWNCLCLLSDAVLGQLLLQERNDVPLKPVTIWQAETRTLLLFCAGELKASLVTMHVINRWFGGLGNGKHIHQNRQVPPSSPTAPNLLEWSCSRLNMKKYDFWWRFMKQSLWIRDRI